jgi:2'-hydroxyisoflavone reductase
VWLDNAYLLEQGVEPWTDLPLWLGGDPEYEWMDHVDTGPAVRAGLQHRPIDETIEATLQWHREHLADPARAGFKMTPEREVDLLSFTKS